MVAVDVGDMAQWMDVCQPEVAQLADAIESRLAEGQEVILPVNSQFENVRNQWSALLESL